MPEIEPNHAKGKFKVFHCPDCNMPLVPGDTSCLKCGKQFDRPIPKAVADVPEPSTEVRPVNQAVSPQAPITGGTVVTPPTASISSVTKTPGKDAPNTGKVILAVLIVGLIGGGSSAVVNSSRPNSPAPAYIPPSSVTSGPGQQGSSGNSGLRGIYSNYVLNGIYIENDSGRNLAFTFDSTGCSLGMDVQHNPNTQVNQGVWLFKRAKYALTGSTLRISGGEATDEGKMASVFGSDRQSGGDVILLTRTDDGQVLEDRSGSRVLHYIKQ